jgi:hypothetical protein
MNLQDPGSLPNPVNTVADCAAVTVHDGGAAVEVVGVHDE